MIEGVARGRGLPRASMVRGAISGVRHSSAAKTSYKIHEIANDHLTVREFESGGVIFGIAWQGARHPDLTGLLGRYYGDFQDASNQAARAEKVKGR